ESPLLELRVGGAGAVGAEVLVVGAEIGPVAPGVVVEGPDHLQADGLRLVRILAHLVGAAVPGGVVEDVLEAGVGDHLEVRRAILSRRRALVIDALGRQRGLGPCRPEEGEGGHAPEQRKQGGPRPAAWSERSSCVPSVHGSWLLPEPPSDRSQNRLGPWTFV